MSGLRLWLAALIAALGVCRAAAQEPAARELFVRPDKGACISCHQLPDGAGPSTRANVGPKLAGERMRALGRDALRALVEDPTRANPETVMPPYGRHRILDAAEISRLVEYLHALP